MSISINVLNRGGLSVYGAQARAEARRQSRVVVNMIEDEKRAFSVTWPGTVSSVATTAAGAISVSSITNSGAASTFTITNGDGGGSLELLATLASGEKRSLHICINQDDHEDGWND